MLYLLNKNTKLQIFIILTLLAWSVWNVFFNMTFEFQEGQLFLYQPIARLAQFNPLAIKIVVTTLIFISLFAITSYFNKQKFVEFTTFMPGVFFLLLLNCGHFLNSLSPALFTICFITIIMTIFTPGLSPVRLKNRIFLIGILISIATLTDIAAFGIVLFVIVTITTNSVSSLKDFLILLSGLLLPYVYTFSIVYFYDAMPAFLQSWRDVNLFSPVKHFMELRIIDYVAMSYFLILMIVFIIRGKNYFDNKLIILRQAFNNVHLQYISMSLFLLLGGIPFTSAIIYLVPSATEYLTISTIHRKYRFLYDILTVVLFLLLWL